MGARLVKRVWKEECPESRARWSHEDTDAIVEHQPHIQSDLLGRTELRATRRLNNRAAVQTNRDLRRERTWGTAIHRSLQLHRSSRILQLPKELELRDLCPVCWSADELMRAELKNSELGRAPIHESDELDSATIGYLGHQEKPSAFVCSVIRDWATCSAAYVELVRSKVSSLSRARIRKCGIWLSAGAAMYIDAAKISGDRSEILQ